MGFKSIALVASTLVLSTSVNAAIITSIGSGTAVSNADHMATFDNISGSLFGYTENGLTISVNDTQCCFNNVYYGTSGNNSFVSISTSDGSDFFGLELDFGTGFDDGLHSVVWETQKDGSTTDSGVLLDIFASKGLFNGFSTLGWSDVDLFDTLMIGAAPMGSTYDAFGGLQAIAIDNVRVDVDVSVVPVPAAVWLFGSGLLALVGIARRKKA